MVNYYDGSLEKDDTKNYKLSRIERENNESYFYYISTEFLNDATRLFYETPEPPYSIGDIWFANDDVLRCIVSREGYEDFDKTDWKQVTNYDEKINAVNEKVEKVIEDGIVDNSELNIISDALLRLEKDYNSLQKDYEILNINANLSPDSNNALNSYWNTYETSYINLVNSIKGMIYDGVITELEKESYRSSIKTYNNSYSDLTGFITKCKFEINNTTSDASIKLSEKSILSTVSSTYVKLDDSVNYTVVIDNEHQGIPVDSNNYPLTNSVYSINFKIYKGSSISEIGFSIKSISSSTSKGIVCKKYDKYITLETDKNVAFTELEGYVDVVLSVVEYEFTKRITWNLVKNGSDGVNGTPGINGISSYLHIKYAPNSNPTASQITETVQDYIGVYVDNILEDSNDPSVYTWSKLIGKDGTNGTNGIPGTNGTDGKTTYLHIKYSDDLVNFTSNSGETPGKYMGQYTDFIQADSMVFNNYIWSQIRGEDGADGTNGTPGVNGKDGVSNYFHIKYSPVANPTSAQMTEIPSDYIGTYVDENLTDSNDPGKYKWSRFRGQDGNNGINGTPGTNGTDGKTYYLHIKYSNDGSTFTSNSGETPGDYLGQYVDTVEADSMTFSKYTWSRIKGDTGPQGVPGTNGTDGKTYYTWIRYADDSNGTGISNSPTGKLYIGLAYNKTTATESNTASDYKWSLIKGTDGVPGTNGADGKTYYTWIKYSDYSDGTSLYDTPNSNTKYIGIAVNKTTATESTSKTDYTWSLFRGENGSNALSVTASATSQVFKSTDGGITYIPDSITVTANYQNCSHSTWQYSTGGSFSNLSNGTGGITVSGSTLTIPKTCSLFTSTINSISFKCISNNSNVFDIITIFKLLDRADINEVIQTVQSAIEQTSEDWKATFKNGYNEGITTISQYGVNVDHSSAGTMTQMSANGLDVIDKSTGEIIASLASKESWTELRVNKVFADNIDNIYKGNSTIYVNHSYTGVSDGTLSKPFKSFADLQSYLSLTKIINSTLNINVLSTGNVTESFTLDGLYGTGDLNITLANDCTYQGEGTREAGIKFSNVNLIIKIVSACLFNDFLHGALFYNCGYVTITNCIFNVPNYGILFSNTNASAYTLDFANSWCPICSDRGSVVHVYSASGNGRSECFRVTNGGIVIYGKNTSTSIPNGTMKNEGGYIYKAGECGGSNSWKYPPSNPVPTPPSGMTYNALFNATAIATYQYNWSNWSSGECKSGVYGSNGDKAGHIFFDLSAVRNFLNSGTVVDGATITLTRANNGGSSGGVSISVGGSNCSSASGTPSYSNRATVGTLGWGQTATFSLSKAIVDGIKNGTINSITTYGSNYSNIVSCNINLKINK